MQKAKNFGEYRQNLKTALGNEVQRKNLDAFFSAYPQARKKAFEGLPMRGMIQDVARCKDHDLENLDELLAEFTQNCRAQGVQVHVAGSAQEANEIICQIARDNNVEHIVKSKSMTAEETLLNHKLEHDGFEVTETDLGEWIVQLRGDAPSHMVLPAIHLSRYQVQDLFSQYTNTQQPPDVEKLVKVARRELRQRYIDADMGITGANFCVAQTGAMGLVTNEGNARLVATLPRVHVALAGLDKLTATTESALKTLRVLPRNATGQYITSYVSWIFGSGEHAPHDDSSPDKKIRHIVFLDNGRRALARDPSFKEVLRCVRCGACANVCPIYRMVGGHEYGHIYVGAIGLILTYFFHGKDKAKNLLQNCLNCQSCKDVCAAGIDLPRIIKEVYAEIQDDDGHPKEASAVALLLKNRRLFYGLLKAASVAQKPFVKKDPGEPHAYLRHPPLALLDEHNFRDLPPLADKPFRDAWPSLKPKVSPKTPLLRVALFAGCVQDFVYPEQLEAAVELLADRRIQVDFPKEQTCCGLPARMMGELEAAKEVAAHNVKALDPTKYDYILTMCASCGGYMRELYPRLLESWKVAVKAEQLAERVISFSQLVHDVLNLDERFFAPQGQKVTFHCPCHLARGMDVGQQPNRLIQAAGYDFAPMDEERVCCGFGGTYSAKFPRLSRELADKKVANIQATGADVVVTECPGCTMQLRGSLHHQGSKVDVLHLAELLAKAQKK